jgi:hypothetical protein
MGRDPATLTCLADLVEMEIFKTGLHFFLDREGGTSSTQVGHFLKKEHANSIPYGMEGGS